MTVHVARIGKQGRIVVPADMRSELLFSPGTEVIMSIRDGALVIEPLDRAVAGAQSIFARYAQEAGRSLADELIEERRDES